MSLTDYVRAVSICVVCFLTLGCGPSQATLSGTVHLDGQPLADGQLRLEGVEANSEADATTIVNGAYKISIAPGKYKVQLNASRQVGERLAYEGAQDSPKIPLMESIIPEKYNVRTELSVELTAGAHQKDFQLTSDPKP